jgi:hypothetical protein
MEIDDRAIPPVWEWMPPDCLPHFFKCVEDTDASNLGESLFRHHHQLLPPAEQVMASSSTSFLSRVDVHTLAGRILGFMEAEDLFHFGQTSKEFGLQRNHLQCHLTLTELAAKLAIFRYSWSKRLVAATQRLSV